jgi:hypothetical protein
VKRLAVVVAESEVQSAPERGLRALRGALASAGAAAREEVVLDFLDDDLREAESALDCLGEYVADVATTLRDARAGRRELMALARGRHPEERLDNLQVTLAGLRRRLAQLAARLPP